MILTVLADLDAGFTNEGFAVNFVLQTIAATIGGLIAVGGAFLIAVKTFERQVAHDFAVRRDEDEARRAATEKERTEAHREALRAVALELWLNHSSGIRSLNLPFHLTPPFRTAALQYAMPSLSTLSPLTRRKVLAAYESIDVVNSHIGRQGGRKENVQQEMLDAIDSARTALAQDGIEVREDHS